jgi:hypothetical protein
MGLDLLDSPRLLGWVVRCDAIAYHVTHARERGCDFGDPSEGDRETATGGSLRWRATTDTICGGLVPFLILQSLFHGE